MRFRNCIQSVSYEVLVTRTDRGKAGNTVTTSTTTAGREDTNSTTVCMAMCARYWGDVCMAFIMYGGLLAREPFYC